MTSNAGPQAPNFMPGMDFLQSLAQSAGQMMAPGVPAAGAAHPWLLSGMDLDELDQRIKDLKTVQFWLEQNTRLLSATIQSLEVQRMTVATLKGMNVSIQEAMGQWSGAAAGGAAGPAPAAAPEPAAPEPAAPSQSAGEPAPAAAASGAAAALQWWHQVAQQFGQIAATVTAPVAAAAASAAAADSAPVDAAPPAESGAAGAPGAAGRAAPARKTSGARTARAPRRSV